MFELSDTVQAEIEPIDLVPLITKLDEEHFAKYGRNQVWNYETRLGRLAKDEVYTLLETNRLVREITKALLNANQPVQIEGRGYEPELDNSTNDFAHPPTIPTFQTTVDIDYNILPSLTLLNNQGLIQQYSDNDDGEIAWCFQSEKIIAAPNRKNGEELPGYGEIRYEVSFEANKPLRAALTTMLEPFAAENDIFASYKPQ